MATIRLCDYTKRRIAADEATYSLTLNGKSYEICLDALTELQTRLDSDEVPAPQAPQKPAVRRAAPQPPRGQDDDAALNAEAPSPFDGPVEPQLVDDAEVVNTQPTRTAEYVAPIALPNSTKERLPMPTTAQAEAVVAESQRFPAGTLRALSPGRHRNVAAEKLTQKESALDKKINKDKERLS